MKEPIEAVIARIDANAQFTREGLEKHIMGCDKLRENVIRPMWEKHQQDIGARKTSRQGGKVVGFCINVGIALVAALAAVKGMAK